MGSSCGTICVFTGYYPYIYYRGTPSTYLGPTFPIIWPFVILSPTFTIKLGLEWQYENLISPLEVLFAVKVMVKPPPPKKPTNEIVPSATAINSNPSGAPISTPLWNVDAPPVGAFLLPKYEFIFEIPGAGQSRPVVKVASEFVVEAEFTGMKNIEINIVKIIMT